MASEIIELNERAAFYRAQAARERAELEQVTLPMIRARHAAAIVRWERLALRAEAGWNNKITRVEGGPPLRSEPVRSGGWSHDHEQELVACV